MASSLELNKLLAGVLTAGVIAVGAAVLSGLLYSPRPLEEQAFAVVVDDAETVAADDEAGDAEAAPSVVAMLASADPAAGQTITRQCTACHVFDEGGDNRVGPVLWDVIGRDVASVDGFAYSDALQGIDGEWTYEKLDGFLANPREWAPGTSMSYAGVQSAEDRANLIAYLREQSADPVPLPDEEEVAEAEPDAAGEEPAEAAAAEAEGAEAAPEQEVATADETAEGSEPAEASAAAESDEPSTEVAEETAEAAEEEVAATEEAVEEPAEVQAEAETAEAETAESEVAEAEGEESEVAEAEGEESEPAESEAAESGTDVAEAEPAEAPAADESAETDEGEAAVAEAAPAEATEEAASDAAETADAETADAETGGGEMSGMVALVADADPATGEQNFRQCAACHTPNEGGANRVGPNLWGVFGDDVASKDGFNYSDALSSIDGIWTVEKLDAYLENPREYAPGNRMAFGGVRDEATRAAVIAYLHSLSNDPAPVDIE